MAKNNFEEFENEKNKDNFFYLPERAFEHQIFGDFWGSRFLCPRFKFEGEKIKSRQPS